MLYPIENAIREIKSLSGIWNFIVDKNNEGYKKKWYKSPLKKGIPMPVPSSYNDVTQSIEIRDHIGDVWYEREFYVPESWQSRKVMLRFGSVSHKVIVWVNGNKVGTHKGGFLPFEFDVTEYIEFNKSNRLTVLVNNILDWSILPPGDIIEYTDNKHPKGYKIQQYYHDFYNYAGIHRDVLLYALPENYIEDITIITDINDKAGIVDYEISVNGKYDKIVVKILDENKDEVIFSEGLNKEKIFIKNVNLWEPGNAYLYNFEVNIFNNNKLCDKYSLPFGVRTVKIEGDKFLINNKPFYFKGFGKHEDSDIRGKGFDNVINVKDFNLLKWIGANSFRTSHYPYSDELMYLADREGVVIIDEVPAVGLNLWDKKQRVFTKGKADDKLLQHHIQVVEELIARDKNHPSVVMWSLANEPASYEEKALPYFVKVVNVAREMDPSRPVTLVNSSEPNECKVAQLFDVVSFNRYYSWYADPGGLDLIKFQLEKDLKDWHNRFKKPIIIAEFGADTISGMHSSPPVMFSEEYQIEMIKNYCEILDKYNFVVGEHIWNFADFATKQGITRVGGNKKGVFTRQRQPKSVAFYLKERWNNL